MLQKIMRVICNFGRYHSEFNPVVSRRWFIRWQRNADIGGHQSLDSRSAVRVAQRLPSEPPFLCVERNSGA